MLCSKNRGQDYANTPFLQGSKLVRARHTIAARSCAQSIGGRIPPIRHSAWCKACAGTTHSCGTVLCSENRGQDAAKDAILCAAKLVMTCSCSILLRSKLEGMVPPKRHSAWRRAWTRVTHNCGMVLRSKNREQDSANTPFCVAHSLDGCTLSCLAGPSELECRIVTRCHATAQAALLGPSESKGIFVCTCRAALQGRAPRCVPSCPAGLEKDFMHVLCCVVEHGATLRSELPC